MIGKSQVQITAQQMASGLPTSDYLGDGGIGIESQNLNPLITQGVIYANYVASSSGVSGYHLVASCEDFNNPQSESRYMVGADSYFYYTNAANTVTEILQGSAGYTLGQTDMTPFAYTNSGSVIPACFISHDTDISRLKTSGGTQLTENYFSNLSGSTTLKSNVPHPLLVYQTYLWVGDGQNLHSLTTGNTVALDVLTLDQNESIISLGIDPATGLMMIGVRAVASGLSATAPARSFIYLFDGYSARSRRKIPISGTPLSFTTVGGQVFVGIDNSIGLWNGNGVTFVRRLSLLTSLVYKHKICAINNLLFVCDNTNILVYGDIQNGKKVWFPFFSNTSGSNTMDIIFQQSIGILGLSYDATTVEFITLFSGGGGTGTLYTPVISFARPTDIRMIRVFTTGITTTTGIGSIQIINEKQQTIAPTVNSFVVSSASSPQYVFDFYFGDPKLQSLQVAVGLATQTFGIIKMIVYYDTTE